ncbi:MAG: hypothetical protein M3P26_06995, partial [Gemmatimonadota bacterium]|nr:hypothetical protein [Gemmatimonadota bacterium]
MPLTPETVARIDAVPAAIAVTTPEEETLAIPGVSEDQVIVWPTIILPVASFTTAEAWVARPTEILVESNATATEATEGATDGGASTIIDAL